MAVSVRLPNQHQENATPNRKMGSGPGKDLSSSFMDSPMKNGKQASGSNHQGGQGNNKSSPQSKASVAELEGFLKRLGQEKAQAQTLDAALERAGVSEAMKFCSRHRIEAFDNLECMIRGDIRVVKLSSGQPTGNGNSGNHGSANRGGQQGDKLNSVLQVRPGNGNGAPKGQRQGANDSHAPHAGSPNHANGNNSQRSPPSKVGPFGTSSPMRSH